MKREKKISQNLSHRFSNTISQVNGCTRKHGITVRRLFRLIGNRSTYILLFLSFFIVSLPFPMPPGFTMILAIPSILFAAQNLYGVETLYVPKFINEIRVSKNVIRKIDKISRKYVFTIEKITCQRLSFLCGPKVRKIHDIVLLIFAIASAVPIPMLCIIPALGGVLLSIGLVVSDGLLIIISWLIGTVGISIIWTAIIAFIKVKEVVPVIG